MHSDCLVIGAGLGGAFAALHMAEQGLIVTLIDAKSIPDILDGIEAEMLPFICYRSDHLNKFRHKSLRVCQNFFENCTELKDIENISLIRLIIGTGNEGQAKLEYKHLRHQENSVEFVSQADLGQLELKMGSEILGAIVHHEVPLIKSEQLYSSLWKTCENHKNITIMWDTNVFGIDMKKGRVVAVRTQKGPIETEHVLLAAGTGSLGILSATGIQIPAVEEKTYRLVGKPARVGRDYFVTEYTPATESEKTDVNDAQTNDLQVSLSAFLGPDKYVSVGGGKELVISKHSSESIAFNELGRHFVRILPGYKKLRFHKAVSRCDTLTVDGLPVVGCLPNATGLYMALYARDDQSVIAPAIGESIGHWIIGKEPSEEMRPLFPERFSQTAPGGEKRVEE